MPRNTHALTIRDAAGTLRSDLKDAGGRLLRDARSMANAGVSDARSFIERQPLIFIALGFVAGGMLGWWLRRR